MCVAPAIGGAIVARPGTNFAMTSALTPQRSKRDCVSLTHESGVSEILHNSFMTPLPNRRPARYHAMSATKLPARLTASNDGTDSFP